MSFQDNSGTYVAKTPGVLNTLVKDVGNSLWKETTPDGHVTAYPLNTTGQIASLSYAEDAIGNRHSYSYSAGLLQTIQDSVEWSRRVPHPAALQVPSALPPGDRYGERADPFTVLLCSGEEFVRLKSFYQNGACFDVVAPNQYGNLLLC